MANITEEAIWDDGIYQLETTDPVQGGADGVDNKPHKNLANRTQYLKQEVEKRAALNGDKTKTFKVADAVEPEDAIPKQQFEEAFNNISGFPTGTRMLFQQSAAPTGWTKESDVNYNDRAIRIVTGNVVNGGSVGFTTAFKSQNVGATTLTVAQTPAHNHVAGAGTLSSAEANKFTYGRLGSTVTGVVSNSGYSGAVYSTYTSASGSSGSHTHSLNLAVKYTDVIIAQKA